MSDGAVTIQAEADPSVVTCQISSMCACETEFMRVHVCMCVCVSVRACKEVARIWLNQSWHTYGEINVAHIRMSARFDESLHTYGGISHGTHG